MKDPTLQNETAETYEIGVATKRVQRTLGTLSEMKDYASRVSIVFHFVDFFPREYTVLCLWRQKHKLAVLLKNIPSSANIETVLKAGELLQKLEDFKNARSCFAHVIVNIDGENQDFRLRALMGKLEIEVTERLQASQYDDQLAACGNVISMWRELVLRDIDLASVGVKADLKARLARVDFQIGQIELRRTVNATRDIYFPPP